MPLKPQYGSSLNLDHAWRCLSTAIIGFATDREADHLAFYLARVSAVPVGNHEATLEFWWQCNQATLCAGVLMTSTPLWNVTPWMTWGNWIRRTTRAKTHGSGLHAYVDIG